MVETEVAVGFPGFEQDHFSLGPYAVPSELLGIPQPPFGLGKDVPLLEAIGELSGVFGGETLTAAAAVAALPGPAALEEGERWVQRRLVWGA